MRDREPRPPVAATEDERTAAMSWAADIALKFDALQERFEVRGQIITYIFDIVSTFQNDALAMKSLREYMRYAKELDR